MDEITVVIKGVRVTLQANGDCLLWADHRDACPDPDVAIRTGDLREILDFSLYLDDSLCLDDSQEEDPHA